MKKRVSLFAASAAILLLSGPCLAQKLEAVHAVDYKSSEQAEASLAALMQVGHDVPQLENWLKWTLAISVWLAVISTVHSGIGYVLAAWKHVVD